MAEPIVAAGVTRFRVFGAGIKRDETWKSNDFAAAKALRKRCPTAELVVRIGLDEATKDDNDRIIVPARPLGEDDVKRMFAAVAKAIDGIGDWLTIELDNETNWANYLDFGQSIGKVSKDVVKYDLMVAKIARQQLGKSRRIVGQSVGYNAGIEPHVGYCRAKVDAGILDLVDVWNDHAYPDGGAAMLDEQLGQQREIIGPSRPFWLTETGAKRLKGKPVAAVAKEAAAYAAVFRAHDVVPFWYRGHPGKRGRWADPYSLVDAKGVVNTAIVKAFGLRAVTA